MRTIEVSDDFVIEDNETTMKKALRDKILETSSNLNGMSLERIHKTLESLSDDLRNAMATSSVECYDTLVELDNLCYEAEIRQKFDYVKEVKSLVMLYEQEVLSDT